MYMIEMMIIYNVAQQKSDQAQSKPNQSPITA